MYAMCKLYVFFVSHIEIFEYEQINNSKDQMNIDKKIDHSIFVQIYFDGVNQRYY